MTAPCPLPAVAVWLIRTPAGREVRLSARLVEVAQALHDAPNQEEAAAILHISRATLQRDRIRLLATLDVDTLHQAIALLVNAHLLLPPADC
jgi:hypothetical protein